MSIDSYFCFCCLSSNELSSLYDSSTSKSYAQMLENIFSFKTLQGDNESDCFICQECIRCLEDAHQFKTRVYQTLDILQRQGLIELNKINGALVIKTAASHSTGCDDGEQNDNDTADEKNNIVSANDVKVKVDVKHEEEHPFDASRNKATVTSIITQPMVKVHVETKVYDIEVSACPYDGANSTQSTQTQQKNQPVDSAMDTVDDRTEEKILVKNEQEKDAHTSQAIKCERDKDWVENVPTNMNKMRSYEVTDDLTCKLCKKRMPNLYVYHTHMNGHMPHHICETCGKGFPNPVKLRRHRYSHQKGPFVCESCGDTFTNYNTYCGHKQRNHSAKAQYACPQCEDRFRSFARRARHLHEVHGIKVDYTCQECGKSFLVAGTLSTHIREIHRKVTRHSCALCPAAFFHRAELSAHEGSAHGTRHAHECQHCGKRFPRKKALTVHQRTHTNDKPFGCALCDKKFTQKCALVAHIRVHSRGKKPREIAKIVQGKINNRNQVLMDTENIVQSNNMAK